MVTKKLKIAFVNSIKRNDIKSHCKKYMIYHISYFMQYIHYIALTFLKSEQYNPSDS